MELVIYLIYNGLKINFDRFLFFNLKLKIYVL